MEMTKNMLKDVQNQLEFTYNEHSVIHLAINTQVIEIVTLQALVKWFTKENFCKCVFF